MVNAERKSCRLFFSPPVLGTQLTVRSQVLQRKPPQGLCTGNKIRNQAKIVSKTIFSFNVG